MNLWIRNLCGSLAAMLITLTVGQSALAAGTEDILRTAVIVDLQGVAKVQPAGSSLQYDAFEGMTLRQGDRLIVDQGGAQLRVEDTGDEINLGEYSLLDISQLSGGMQGRTTKLTMLSGVAYFAVTDLRGKPDTFQVVNGNHTLDVKGTHFIVSTDPVTGASILGVMAGAVSMGNSRPPSGGSFSQLPPTVIYPAQQIYLGGGETSGPSGPSVVDPTRLIQNAPANVIESLLRNAEKIQKENEQTKKSLEEQANTPKQPADPSLPLQMGDLNKISQNMSNLVGNLAQEAVKQQKLSSGQVQQLIDEANRTLEGNGKIDLDKVQPLDPTAGVDPEAVKKEQLLKEMQEKKKRELQEQQNNLQALIQRIVEQQEKLQEENRKAQEEAQARAQEQFLSQLQAQDREQFLAAERRLEQERIQRGGATPPSTTPAVPTAPSGGTSAPSNPGSNPNPNPNPEPSASFTLNWQYADETSIPMGIQHTMAFGLTLKEGVEPKSDKLKVKVTLSSNVPEAVYSAISYDFKYDSLTQTELSLEACGTSTAASCGEAWLPSEEDAGYDIEALGDGWPAVLSAIWMESGNYTVTVEAFQTEGDALVSLGKQSFQFTVSEEMPAINFTGGESSVNLEQLTYAFSAKGENILPSYQIALRASIYGESAPAVTGSFTLYHNDTLVASETVDESGTAYLTGGTGVLAALLAAGSDFRLELGAFEAEPGTYEIGLRWFYLPTEGFDPYPFSDEKVVGLNVGTP